MRFSGMLSGPGGRVRPNDRCEESRVSQHDTSAHEFVAFIEGQARRFADPDRRRIDDATLRVQDFLRGCELDPHDTTVIRTVHAALQLLADEAGRQVAIRHLLPNDALVHAAGELW
jgi:hypothetical protein